MHEVFIALKQVKFTLEQLYVAIELLLILGDLTCTFVVAHTRELFAVVINHLLEDVHVLISFLAQVKGRFHLFLFVLLEHLFEVALADGPGELLAQQNALRIDPKVELLKKISLILTDFIRQDYS